jgi:hypothetical protein
MAVRTGADYVRALRDGRDVWHAGRRIEDVTAHSDSPARSRRSPICTTSSTQPNTAK